MADRAAAYGYGFHATFEAGQGDLFDDGADDGGAIARRVLDGGRAYPVAALAEAPIPAREEGQ